MQLEPTTDNCPPPWGEILVIVIFILVLIVVIWTPGAAAQGKVF